MYDIWIRIAVDLTDRVSDPMKFRFVLQLLMASIFAIRAGLADARLGKNPYSWALLSNPLHRAVMVKDGWQWYWL